MEDSGPEKKRIDQNLEELGPKKWKRTSPIGDEEDFREEGHSALSPREKTARINVSETESTHSFLTESQKAKSFRIARFLSQKLSG